jgi:hypothetical protein
MHRKMPIKLKLISLGIDNIATIQKKKYDHSKWGMVAKWLVNKLFVQMHGTKVLKKNVMIEDFEALLFK